MKAIKNPFIHHESYACFGCQPGHPFGLRMKFFETEDKVVCRWPPNEQLQGYGSILHGGIQATLADEIASWLIYVKQKTAGVTSRLEIDYLKPVYVNRGDILLEATIQEIRDRLTLVRVGILNENGELCAKAVVTYYTYPPKIAERKLNYPGHDAFYE